MDDVRRNKRELRDVTKDRREVAQMTLRTEAIAERLRQRTKNAKAAGALTMSITLDEVETMAKDFEVMGKLGKHVHDELMKEEIRTRPSEPIPIR